VRRVLAAVTAVLVAPCAAGAATPASGSPRALVVIRVTSVTTGVVTTDRPPKGVSKGDRYVFRDRLLNAARQFGKPIGARVGGDRGSVVLTSKTNGVTRGVATLPDGTIRFGGNAGITALTYRILGGTGRYAHARGILVVGQGDSPLNTYRLSLPAKPGGTLIVAHPPAGGMPTYGV
jgi:hypothetical protein